MNEVQQNVLRKLMHEPCMTFNELWNKEGESNKFAYHLKSLEGLGFIKKTDEGYKLTHMGKKHSTYIEGETGKVAKFPLVGVVIVIYDEEKKKFLMNKRAKEPFYGVWGFQGGKIKFDQYIYECANAEIMEETGLECDIELKGLSSFKTYNDGELSYNHQMFIVKATNPRGTLIESTREGKNEWFSIEEIDKLKSFSNVSLSIQTALGDKFRWVEADRMQENDEFKEINVLRNQEF